LKPASLWQQLRPGRQAKGLRVLPSAGISRRKGKCAAEKLMAIRCFKFLKINNFLYDFEIFRV
jgi:hypothetical protein